jgi:hypothetical protein
MSSLLEQLHDIEGLDQISSWPLAIGWWVVIAIGFIVACAIARIVFNKLAFKRSWRNDAFQKLALLEKSLTDANAKETLVALSEFLRRIVLRRFPRNECAGLAGEAWLKWLAMHDPKGFDWEKRGDLLTRAPYAPMTNRLSVHQIKDLIQAVREWVS